MEPEEKEDWLENLKNRFQQPKTVEKEIAGLSTEVAAGLALDARTAPLLAGGPKGWLAYAGWNFGGGVTANLAAQRLRGEENIRYGELLSSGLLGIIPGTSLRFAKKGTDLTFDLGKTGNRLATNVLGDANTYQRAATFGAGQGLTDTAIRSYIDDGELPTGTELAVGAATGGVVGPAFKKAGATFNEKQVVNRLKVRFNPGLVDEVLAAGDDVIYPPGSVEEYIQRNYQAMAPRRNVNNPDQGSLFDVTEYLGPLRPESKEAARVFNELIATKSGYASMAEFKRTVLNRWPRKYQEQLFRELWQNQNYEGYIEHLIQKADYMDWYWNMKGLDRNAVENVRILFNDSMKGFKDTVEKIVHGYRRRDGTFVPGKGWQSPNLKDRLIVSFEDPMKRTKTFLRQNPGDVIIMRAGSNKIIGNLGQYFDVLYPQDALGKRLLREGSKKAGFKNVTEFRRAILEQRIDTIIADSHTIPANRTAAKRWIKQNIDEDMINLIQQYPFLQPNPAIKKQMIKDGLLPGSFISPIN